MLNIVLIVIVIALLIVIALMQLRFTTNKRHTRALDAALAGSAAIIVDLVHHVEEQRKMLVDQQRLIEEPFTEDEIAAIRKLATDDSDDSQPFNLVKLDFDKQSQ